MMGVVPIYDAQFNIGPVCYLAFGKPETTVSRTNELEESLHTVKESGRSVGSGLSEAQMQPRCQTGLQTFDGYVILFHVPFELQPPTAVQGKVLTGQRHLLRNRQNGITLRYEWG